MPLSHNRYYWFIRLRAESSQGKPQMTASTDRFDLSGGHPALDFINTLDERPFPEPIENLADFTDLVRFAELTGLVTSGQARALRKLAPASHTLVARRARQLREHVYGALTALQQRKTIPPHRLQAVSAAIREARAAQALTVSKGRSIAGYGWRAPNAAEVPLHACAIAIEDLLTGADRGRIRKCGASDCEVFFLDKSKGRRRHWCSMKNCGNREKQRRWRAS
jgi:predicted RNA-binding Zn ribbon-like protein